MALDFELFSFGVYHRMSSSRCGATERETTADRRLHAENIQLA